MASIPCVSQVPRSFMWIIPCLDGKQPWLLSQPLHPCEPSHCWKYGISPRPRIHAVHTVLAKRSHVQHRPRPHPSHSPITKYALVMDRCRSWHCQPHTQWEQIPNWPVYSLKSGQWFLRNRVGLVILSTPRIRRRREMIRSASNTWMHRHLLTLFKAQKCPLPRDQIQIMNTNSRRTLQYYSKLENILEWCHRNSTQLAWCAFFFFFCRSIHISSYHAFKIQRFAILYPQFFFLSLAIANFASLCSICVLLFTNMQEWDAPREHAIAI